eukprot:gene6756-biopygen1126
MVQIAGFTSLYRGVPYESTMPWNTCVYLLVGKRVGRGSPFGSGLCERGHNSNPYKTCGRWTILSSRVQKSSHGLVAGGKVTALVASLLAWGGAHDHFFLGGLCGGWARDGNGVVFMGRARDGLLVR